MSMKIFLPLVICSISHSFLANSAETVAVAFGNSLPPWVMKGGKSGIVVELVKDCLEPDGYVVEPVLLPYARRLIGFSRNHVDVVTDINSKTIKEHEMEGYFTGHFYAYENMAFSLAENNFPIKKISDLKNYSLVSWQGAISHLGGEYAEMAKNNSNYSEVHDQKTQVKMLYRKRTSFIQMDSQIFDYYQDLLVNSSEINQDVKIDRFSLFGKSPNGLLFKTKELRDVCLKNIEKIRLNKKYQDVLYLDN